MDGGDGMNTRDADLRIMRLVQQCDQERRARLKAEREARALRATLARVLAMQRRAKAEKGHPLQPVT
jgi:hypothetical protein